MSARADLLRRAVTLALAVLALLVVPEVSSAAFRAQTSTAQGVSTAALPVPSAVSGTWSCATTAALGHRVQVSVSGVAVTGGPAPTGTTYVVELLGSAAAPLDAETVTSPGTPVTLSFTRGALSNREFRVRVRAELRTWTTPSLERAFSCPVLVSGDGPL